ncbi:MAG: Crp/Fnr family transcriptional regulator [Bacteroides sp.]|nr:Crp/Fnr family transcriptional regulator [Roseburia sp.]MCM1346723.1 Crp/Fnr family transcriptional regulator [Bacteroides sp.]MCM1421297.1 Crp/Fnr family transcriptional regulator [Bacteroides sp.]
MANFNSYIDALDMDFWLEVCSRTGTLRHYKKGEVFVKDGEPAKYWGVVVRGYFKYVITDDAGNDHVTGFTFSNNLVGDFLSIVGKSRARACIVAATDTDVMLSPLAVIQQLFDKNPMLRQTLSEGLFEQAYTQYLDMFRLSPKARYVALLKRCPDILQHVTLKELASFLQITPTHLSRLRKELTFAKGL